MTAAFSAVVFDLDGTLRDSAPDIARALNDTLAALDLAPFPLPAVKAMVGGGADVLVERALRARGEAPDRLRIERVLAAFLARYRAAPCEATVLYPGALGVLDRLARDGVALGVCTNKPADLTGLVLERLAIRDRFASVVAATPSMPPKPAPHMLQAALARLGAPPDRALMVGDSGADLGTARAAGVACLLLRHGYSAVSVDGLGADAVVDGFAELAGALDQLAAGARAKPRPEPC